MPIQTGPYPAGTGNKLIYSLSQQDVYVFNIQLGQDWTRGQHASEAFQKRFQARKLWDTHVFELYGPGGNLKTKKPVRTIIDLYRRRKKHAPSHNISQ